MADLQDDLYTELQAFAFGDWRYRLKVMGGLACALFLVGGLLAVGLGV